MKKIIFFILGILLCLFGFAQVLQLAGLIGTKMFTISGVGFAILGFALGAACFKKVKKQTPNS
ncbi:MAG: hypothetical protein FWF96_02170 [Kiritimatiellaeota bacterium]|nr:hypothetical protein [Kiritimatiellota bacterium]